jgi:hypothetical protein
MQRPASGWVTHRPRLAYTDELLPIRPRRIKINLMVSVDCCSYITVTRIERSTVRLIACSNPDMNEREATDWPNNQMHAQRKHRRGDLMPVIVAAIVAVVGQAAILFNDFGTGNHSQGSGNMITAAAVSRAGAIEIPSEPPAGRPAS